MNYLLPKDTFQALVDYLTKRPWSEVNHHIAALAKLQQVQPAQPTLAPAPDASEAPKA
jgi:hypothetical protein